MSSFIKPIIVFLISIIAHLSYAKPVFRITADSTSIKLSKTGNTTINFTVVNASGKSLKITNTSISGFDSDILRATITHNQCKKRLANNESCTVSSKVSAKGIVAATELELDICIFNGALCSGMKTAVSIQAGTDSEPPIDPPVEPPVAPTLTPVTQNLTLSIQAPGADPALVGNPRVIRIVNNGTSAVNNVQVNSTPLPLGTSISNDQCTGTLGPKKSCDITITPGMNASLDAGSNTCTTAPGSEPLASTVTISSSNVASTSINVLVLGYGCIFQGGYLFAVDDTTPNTESIAGKVAALTEAPFAWAIAASNTGADSTTDGLSNTNVLSGPPGQFPGAQNCLSLTNAGFTDWYMPAICELARFVGSGTDSGCGNNNPNLYSTLFLNGLGNFLAFDYWSSTEFNNVAASAWVHAFNSGFQGGLTKTAAFRIVRCIRALTP